MFTHAVFFRMKKGAGAGPEAVRDRLLSMAGKIPELRSIDAGVDVIHSDRSYDVALVARFDSKADMEVYQVHPVHQEVIQFIRSVTEGSAAVDFES